MSMQLERRAFDLDEFEVEERADGGPRIRGHAAVFNQLSEPMFGFRERIQPGAFADSLRNDDVRALFNHDPNFVIGRNRAGTLTLREDGVGLAFEVTPPDTQWARDLITSIKRGDINQASFAFRAIQDSFSGGEGDEIIRDLIKVQLFDVSPVTYPAYPQTDVSAHRSLDGVELRELREALRCAVCAGGQPVERVQAHRTHMRASVAARHAIRRRQLEVLELS